jgi:putative FmdB family regulatory protein
MPKIAYEFRCTECGKYFDVKLNVALNGNYRVHCPNCGHIHYRTVKEGKITDTRFPDNHGSILIEDIKPMKSSCRDFQKETILDSDCNYSTESFLHRLWREKFSANIN